MIRTSPWIALTLAVGAGLAALFLVWPGIDLAIMRLLYLGDNDFLIRGTWLAWAVDDLLRPGFTIFTVGLVLLILVRWLAGWPRRFKSLRELVFVALCLAVGPGLIANALFKENWGRARPKQVVEFAGDRQFTPPLVIADQCSGNCSFVAGDAAFAFAFLGFALVASRRRALWSGAALGFGLAVGSLRMMNGSHFGSDVLFAGVFVTLSTLVLYRWIIERRFAEDLGPVVRLFRRAWRRRARDAARGGGIDLLR